MRKKKWLSLLLSVALVLSLFPTIALAADNNKAIQLGTGSISGYSDTNSYDYIYFGYWNASDNYTTSGPVKWRVLDDQTNTGTDGLFLLSDALLGRGTEGGVIFQISYHRDGDTFYKGGSHGDDHTNCQIINAWQGSDAQGWCNDFYSSNLTSQEQSAVLETTKSDNAFISGYNYSFSASDNILNRDKVFFLSAEEAENSAYGFTNDAARIANYGNSAGYWWLRSPYIAGRYAGAVSIYGGNVTYFRAEYIRRAARPAFNLDTDAVLFTSAAAGGKVSNGVGADVLKSVSDYSGSEWKLTLLDDARSGFEASLSSPIEGGIEAGDAVEITYSGARTGGNEYVSAMIVDDAGTVLYYGTIAQGSESGTATINIPSDLAAGDYTLKVFSEQCNGDYQTDYASDFVDISFSGNGSPPTDPTDPTDPADPTAPKLTAGNAVRTSEAGATVVFTSDEAGMYYYAVVESGAQAPFPSDLETNGTTGSCANGTNTITLTTLTGIGAKDIYILAKDAAGNVSDPVRITIPAYEIGGLLLSPESCDFGKLKEGYAAPEAQTITITNNSQYAVTLTQPTANYFEIGTLSETELDSGETATFTVQPLTGFTHGTYSETIAITGSLIPLEIGGDGGWTPGGDTGGDAELTAVTYRAAAAVTADDQENTITASLSASFTVSALLSTPENLTWDSDTPGKAIWSAVENASVYFVQLYKDDSPVGDPVSVTTGTEYSFNITEAGSYTFKVKAADSSETYADSEEAESGRLHTVSFETNGG